MKKFEKNQKIEKNRKNQKILKNFFSLGKKFFPKEKFPKKFLDIEIPKRTYEINWMLDSRFVVNLVPVQSFWVISRFDQKKSENFQKW